MGSCVVCMVRTHNKRHATHAVKKAPMRPRKIPLSGRRRPASPRLRPEERSYAGLFVAHTWSAGLDGGTGSISATAQLDCRVRGAFKSCKQASKQASKADLNGVQNPEGPFSVKNGGRPAPSPQPTAMSNEQ